MNKPTIHVTLQVRGVVAADYNEAKSLAYDSLSVVAMTDELLRNLLQGYLGKYGEGVTPPWRYTFLRVCRVAKECDGTYTVTVP